jgi:hypothetical protein
VIHSRGYVWTIDEHFNQIDLFVWVVIYLRSHSEELAIDNQELIGIVESQQMQLGRLINKSMIRKLVW